MKKKIAATILALIPVLFFLAFAIGEGSGGIGHYLQALPLLALIALGWYRPRIGGWILVAIAMLFTGMYAVGSGMPLGTIIAIGLLIGAPLAASGILFILSAPKE